MWDKKWEEFGTCSLSPSAFTISPKIFQTLHTVQMAAGCVVTPLQKQNAFVFVFGSKSFVRWTFLFFFVSVPVWRTWFIDVWLYVCVHVCTCACAWANLCLKKCVDKNSIPCFDNIILVHSAIWHYNGIRIHYRYTHSHHVPFFFYLTPFSFRGFIITLLFRLDCQSSDINA